MHTKLFILMLTLISCTIINATNKQKVDNRTLFIKEKDLEEKKRLMVAVYSEIVNQNIREAIHLSDLYREVLSVLKNKEDVTAPEQRAGIQLQHHLRRQLVQNTKEKIANSLVIHRLVRPNVRVTADKATVLRESYEAAIDEVYNDIPTDALAGKLNQIYKEGEPLSYELIVHIQLYLFWKFQNRRDFNNEYLLNAGYYFSKMRTDKLHKELSENLVQRVTRAVQQFPSSLQWLYFRHTFCLINNQNREYLVISKPELKYDDKTRYVFTWTKINSTDSKGYTRSDRIRMRLTASDDETGLLDLKFTFDNFQTKLFLFLIDNEADKSRKMPPNITAAGLLEDVRGKHEWSVDFIDDHLKISQNGYYMCASEYYFDKERRYVRGLLKTEIKPSQKRACQWTAGNCFLGSNPKLPN